jgi:DNA-binding NarL/FixJ family response regulator
MRLGVRALLEREGLGIAGITATCTEAVDLVRESAPDVVLLDLSLPDASGVEAIERIRVAAPSVPIVAFSVDRSTDLIRSALRAGANGYVCKDAPAAHVVAALDAAARGLTALGSADAIALTRSPDTRPIVERPEEHVDVDAEEAAEPGAPVAVREPLTPRELELLRYLAEGYTNKEIARAMVLAEDTVKKGVQTLIAKLGATDRTHAVVLALRRRLIE